MAASAVPEAVRALFEARARSIPAELARALKAPIERPILDRASSLVVTGIGASEGPARYLTLLLYLSGFRVAFAPLSTFVVTARPAALGDTLVVFSQGLSPNARIVLRRAAEHRAAFLFTSVTAPRATPEVRVCLDTFERNGGRILVLPPEDESGTLTRLVGPAVALLAAARFAALVGADRAPSSSAAPDPGEECARAPVPASALALAPEIAASAAERLESALSGLPPGALHRRIALVGAGPWLEAAHGLRCKWLEGLGAPEPPLWDIMQVAHGPFQQFFDEEITLVTLEHEGIEAERDLFDRLAAMAVPPRHALLRLRARFPPPLGILDHDAQWTAALVRAIGERSKDLGGAGSRDAPLYGLGREAGTGRGRRPPPRRGR